MIEFSTTIRGLDFYNLVLPLKAKEWIWERWPGVVNRMNIEPSGIRIFARLEQAKEIEMTWEMFKSEKGPN